MQECAKIRVNKCEYTKKHFAAVVNEVMNKNNISELKNSAEQFEKDKRENVCDFIYCRVYDVVIYKCYKKKDST